MKDFADIVIKFSAFAYFGLILLLLILAFAVFRRCGL